MKRDPAKKTLRSRPPPKAAALATIPVVAIGASAGGLDAFKELLGNLSDSTGKAFVLIQHLDPTHKSHLPELLAASTKMPVAEVRAKTRVEANHVYVIAPDRNLTLTDGHLMPTARAKSGLNEPIDSFLVTLAKERRKDATGVVLSGTGKAGTLGLKAIRAHGGMTFAQDLKSAKSPQMPQSAIDSGVVDFVLAPAGIARHLGGASGAIDSDGSGTAGEKSRNARAVEVETELETELQPDQPPPPETEPELVRIFEILRDAGGVDFTYYKHSTIRRRLQRRMILRGFSSLADYTEELARNRDEAILLCQDFFITVTAFFRDPGIFVDLKKTVFPALLARRKQDRVPIRIWVPGCATGEEAYSIAMCLIEFLEDAGVRVPFQIFATDVNEAVIEKARAGIYSEAALAAVSAKRRARFFLNADLGYRTVPQLREVCVFARQNLAKDPPFSRIDLISCCNVLIYLGSWLQRRILPVFHYALQPDGFLMLGSSESIGGFSDLFRPVSKKNKLYRRQATRDHEGSGVDSQLDREIELAGRWNLAAKRPLSPVRQKTKPLLPEAPVPHHERRTVEELSRDLASTTEYLQSLVASKDAALQELKSVSEEAQAGTEELETAQEELQASNEELQTLNEDLRTRNTQLGQLNLDLANLQESISIPLVMVGKDLHIRRFTKAMMPLLNLTLSDVGRPVTDLRPEIELPDFRQDLLAAMSGRAVKPRDLRDAKGCWYSPRIRPTVGPDGQCDGAVFLLIDIDAEKRGRDFAEAIVEAVHEPLLVLRKNLNVVVANKAFYKVFQVSPKETEGRLIFDLGDRQWNIPRLRELLHQILPEHSNIRDFEVEHNFERVGRKVMRLNASEVFDPNAKEPTILLAIEDITDRKRAEESLTNMNVELQHFAYALTHDLREPLRMVVNFTELLAQEYRGKLGLEADQYIEYSVEGAQRMEALMKALLAYWETTAGDHVETTIDCNKALDQAIKNLEVAVKESRAAITYDRLPTVLAEEAMLVQLFQNLIGNAIKYRSTEPLRIHVSAQNGGPDWLFEVRDNGIGIDPQHGERIFGILKRLHGKEIPGTGIGLALCKKIVERRGGRIWVESKVGGGARFKFTIPLATARGASKASHG